MVAVCARGARVFEGELRSHLPVTVQVLRHIPQPIQPLQCLQDTLGEPGTAAGTGRV
jgi:hypothetical protein